MSRFSSILKKKLVRRSVLMLEAASLCLISSAAFATVISSTINLPVPKTTSGIYINLVTGVNATNTASVPGWDFNAWGTSALRFYWLTASMNGGVADAAGGPVSNLNPGDVVGPSAIFVQGAPTPANFEATGYGAVGVKFTNESTGALNYGFVELKSTSPVGLPGTIMAYAYDDSGAPITVESLEGIFINDFE